jgi:hypothetical protein
MSNLAKPSLFEHLDGLTSVKREWEYTSAFKKNYSQYMINRFIGMHDSFLELISEVNKLTLTDEQHYNFLKQYLPKKKIYFKYIKKSHDVLDTTSMGILMDLYKISYDEVLEILEVAPINEVKKIIKGVTNERKVISKRNAK